MFILFLTGTNEKLNNLFYVSSNIKDTFFYDENVKLLQHIIIFF